MRGRKVAESGAPRQPFRMSAPLEHLVTRGDPGAPLLVLLHGRGSDERDLGTLGSLLWPGATVVTPRAPFPGAPWGYGPGWAWYRFLQERTPEPTTFEEGQERLAAFLDWIPEATGTVGAPLVVGGFSQGGTSALAWALRHPGRAAAVLVFSGFLADHPSVEATAETVRDAAFWWGHGTADQMMPFRHGEAGWAALRAAGAELRAFPVDGMGHSITREEVADAAGFLRERMSGGSHGSR